MEHYAIIPARGGSKRIPKKNLRAFLGKPIIQRVLGTLKEAELFERIIVSTDDDEISELVTASGFEVPFRRPAELSDDFASTSEVATHAIDWLLSHGARPDSRFVTVYPTAVMVTVDQLKSAENLLGSDGCNFVFVGTRFPSQIRRAWKQTSLGTMEAISPESQRLRTQDIDQDLFYDQGQFYWSTSRSWNGTQEDPQVRKMLEISPFSAVDIDTEQDWELAERLFKLNRQEAMGPQVD